MVVALLFEVVFGVVGVGGYRGSMSLLMVGGIGPWRSFIVIQSRNLTGSGLGRFRR